MASPRKDERSVTRTYRAAVRLGEDFVTLEETITLPLDASDEEIQQAVDLGWRVYRAQQANLEDQVGLIREAQGAPAPITVRDPDAPASEKQRNYIAALQDDLSWTNEKLVEYATEQHVELVTLTKGQASGFIDNLKRLAEERTAYAEESAPITERQQRALARLAQDRGVILDDETQARFGLDASAITSEQASSLLTEWQRNGRGNNRRAAEPAL